MIATCTSCKTRLRVPEEKIGPKGARIRCGRCKTVFVVPAEAGGAPGGVAADPPDVPRWPELERPPPPSRGSRDEPAAGDEPPPYRTAADPFEPGPRDAAAPSDPFAPAQRLDVAAPPRPVPPPLPGDRDDPFGLPEAAAPARPDDPFGADLGWDPFGVAEPGSGPALEDHAPPSGRATTNVTELLEESEPVKPPSDLGALALEERETPQPRAARSSYDEADLDLGFGMPDVLGPGPDDLLSPGEPPASNVAPPHGGAPRVREPTPLLFDRELPVAPAPPPAAAPAGAAEADPAPPPARGGRFAVAMTNSFSLALLITVAVALFFTWRGGLLGRLRGAMARGTPSVEASAVTGGLYDTAAGSPVLVVRGRIGAKSAVTGPVRVRVELVDGARVVAAAVGLAGSAATAEQVHGAGTPEEAAALRRALDALAAARLTAGESVPFLVVFPSPAPDPRGLTLRVEAEPAPSTASTGG